MDSRNEARTTRRAIRARTGAQGALWFAAGYRGVL